MLIGLVLTLDEETKRERCRIITEIILMFLLIVHSTKVNFVELLHNKKKRKTLK
jgi:hypothetical protein